MRGSRSPRASGRRWKGNGGAAFNAVFEVSTVIVMVAVLAPAARVGEEKVAVAPAGKPVADMVTLSRNVLATCGSTCSVYTTVVPGKNGFMCLVERGWGAATDNENFWNPKLRAPHCFNAAATRTFVPIFLMKTKLVLAGKSKAEVLQATDAAFANKELPTLEPGAMCYMMSKQQYLNDQAKNWHPHLMFFVPGSAEKTWGANLDGSPIIASNDPEERATIMMVVVGQWSDASSAPE